MQSGDEESRRLPEAMGGIDRGGQPVMGGSVV